MSEANTRVVTNEVRFSFFRGITGEEKVNTRTGESQLKYSTMILIPKKDTVTADRIKALITGAIQEKWAGKVPAGLKVSFRDGDKEGKGGVPEGKSAGDEPYGGHYFMSVSSDRKPDVRDEAMQSILDPGAIVSGDYGRVGLNCYTWDNPNGKGVSFGLQTVQLLRKGDPLGSTVSAKDDFTAVAPAAAPEAGSESPW